MGELDATQSVRICSRGYWLNRGLHIPGEQFEQASRSTSAHNRKDSDNYNAHGAGPGRRILWLLPTLSRVWSLAGLRTVVWSFPTLRSPLIMRNSISTVNSFGYETCHRLTAHSSTASGSPPRPSPMVTTSTSDPSPSNSPVDNSRSVSTTEPNLPKKNHQQQPRRSCS